MLDMQLIRPITVKRSVAQAFLEQLALWGVKRIYGVVGDAVFGLADALAKQQTISFITVKHESVAAIMASAEAKCTGRLAVCLSQMGPGLTNLLTGLGDAYMDRAPVLAITGQAPLDKIGASYKQNIQQQQLVRAVAGFTELVAHPDAAMEVLAQAMYTSLESRTVSHLSIPSDLFAAETMRLPVEPPRLPVFAAYPEQMQKALHIMRAAKRPILLVGRGARSVREPVLKLAEIWGAGIVNSYGAVAAVPDAHPFVLNGLGEGGNPHVPGLLQQADVILSIEADLLSDSSIPASSAIVQLARTTKMLAVTVPTATPVIGDIHAVIAYWLEGLSGCAPDPAWVRQIQSCKQSWLTQQDAERQSSASPLQPAAIIRMLERQIADDAIIALDEGDSTLWFLRHFRAEQQNVLLSARWRTMGFGLPAAMAAKLIFPDRQVVCITGDGGLAMVMADLLTAARCGLAVTVILFRNDALQMERDKMMAKGQRPEGTALANPDFAKVAEACGWNGLRIEHAEQLEHALKVARASGNPVLLDVRTANTPHPDLQAH
ncbi:MAG: thiamine pyrophosphate-binding protein [Paenibacillaceae bacterium]|nr:thiamine pyrophosphate-binding protein [Paenibacillaceae bacterium]